MPKSCVAIVAKQPDLRRVIARVTRPLLLMRFTLSVHATLILCEAIHPTCLTAWRQAYAVSANDEKFGWLFDPDARVPDTAPADIRDMIPRHWYNFSPVNPLWHYMLGMVYVVLCE